MILNHKDWQVSLWLKYTSSPQDCHIHSQFLNLHQLTWAEIKWRKRMRRTGRDGETRLTVLTPQMISQKEKKENVYKVAKHSFTFICDASHQTCDL